MAEHSKKPTLGDVRRWLIMLALGAVGLRIALWAIVPFLPYLVGGIMLVTIIGVLLHRTNKF